MKNILRSIVLITGLIVPLSSCKKFLEIEPPISSLTQTSIFQSDEVATSAVTGIYSLMAASGYASGGNTSITSLGGLSADEFKSYNAGFTEFYDDQITTTNTSINSLWLNIYQRIYAANAIIEGLNSPNGVTPPVKTQLMGEALFIRAFNYFYLVNLFGAVPLELTTNYATNEVATRATVDQVYQQILFDLKTAEGLLNDNYITTERIRPNVSTVRALLSRTYLYMQDWPNAEKYATLVISKTGSYSLVNLDAIFSKNSSEAIWQLMPTANTNSLDGNLFILTATPLYVSLNSTFALTGFEPNDKRKTSWVKSFTNSTGTYYFPYKYKVQSSTTITEYSMVMRLAEQYLIRAEARAQQDNLSQAIDDVDLIRNRGGITLIRNTNPGIGKQALLNAIQQERRVELFSEWGHRWLDLKRTNQAGPVLSLIKPNWQATDVLYPIPQTEVSRNIKIVQNPGY